jgi:thymidylate synthase
MIQGSIPVLSVEADGLAEAWEQSLVRLHAEGCDIQTEYDKPGDPPSKDSTMTVVVRNPIGEPMIHKDFPGGLEDLQEYVLEVTEGIKDHLVRQASDPADTRWEYTYHQRMFRYTVPGRENGIDQIERIAEKLARTPHSRRAQAVTWKVWEDDFCYDPPCLQSVWCRMLRDGGGVWTLNMNVRFRSNDAYKAAFMNMFALIRLQVLIGEKISALSGSEVRLGRYVHQADSYHIYGSYFREFEERFMKSLQTMSFEERTFRFEDIRFMMEDAVPAIREKAAKMGRNR